MREFERNGYTYSRTANGYCKFNANEFTAITEEEYEQARNARQEEQRAPLFKTEEERQAFLREAKEIVWKVVTE